MNTGISRAAAVIWVKALRDAGYEPLDDFMNAVSDTPQHHQGAIMEAVRACIANKDWAQLEVILEGIDYDLEGQHVVDATLMWDDMLGGMSDLHADLWVKWS